jgi:hypothetical protein
MRVCTSVIVLGRKKQMQIQNKCKTNAKQIQANRQVTE